MGTLIITVATRRLSQGRRLAGVVEVDYVVTGAEPDAVAALVSAASNPTTLVTAMNEDLLFTGHVISDATVTAVPGEVDQSPFSGSVPGSGASEVFLAGPVAMAVVFASANFAFN